MNIHDIYRPFLAHFRNRRMRDFAATFNLADTTRIVDVGGTAFNWGLIAQKPNVTLVNIRGEPWEKGNIRAIVYDGSKLPFPGQSFDICYSNSVIEHVGGWDRVQNFAAEIRRMAPAYYVQTPNRHFFVEPHFIVPFIHWLPFAIKRRVMRYLSVWGLVTKPDQRAVDEMLNEIRLLTKREMRTLFPDAEIVSERFLGMAKSIIAMRRPR